MVELVAVARPAVGNEPDRLQDPQDEERGDENHEREPDEPPEGPGEERGHRGVHVLFFFGTTGG